MKAICPHCGSHDVKSFEMAHKLGISTSSSQTSGVGVTFGGEVGYGTAVTNSIHISQIAKETAPPEPHFSTLGYLLMIPVILTFALGLLGLLAGLLVLLEDRGKGIRMIFTGFFLIFVTLAVSVYIGKRLNPRQVKIEAENKKRLDDWSRSQICFSCNHRWIN